MNVHDMTWVHMLLGGVKRVHDVREMGLQRERAAVAGKQVNTAISTGRNNIGAHGEVMEHGGKAQSDGGALRAVIWRLR